MRCLRNRAAAYLWGSDEPEQALPDLLRLYSVDNANCSLCCAIALCKHRMGKHSEAIAQYSDAILLDPTFALAYVGRGNVRLCLPGSRQTAAASRDYQKAMHLQPTLASVHVNLGLHAARKGKDLAAWRLFYSSLALDPSNTVALEARAIANAALGRLLAAKLDIDAATELEQQSARLLTTAGLISEIAGDRAAAQQRYILAAKCDPQYGRARFNLGSLYHEIGQTNAALVEYSAALAVEASGGDGYAGAGHVALLNRGAVLVEEGKVEEGIVDFTHVIEKNPRSVAAWINRGRARARVGQWQMAERDYLAAAKLTPLDKDIYKELSVCCQHQHRNRECLVHYATFLDLDDGIIPSGKPRKPAEPEHLARDNDQSAGVV
eukprot:SAG31_NODE_2349_length_5893_cov_3.376251_4_plen_379_part_00